VYLSFQSLQFFCLLSLAGFLKSRSHLNKKKMPTGDDDHHSAVPIGVPTFKSMEEMYDSCYQQIDALLTDNDTQTITQQQQQLPLNPFAVYSKLVTGLANVSSVLFYNMNAQFTDGKDALLHSVPINWCGFYILDRPDRLALSTFQGKVACQHIKLGRGMCGKSVLTNTDLLIADVLAEPGHIACDAASLSEAVICLREPQSGRAVGCLDIDSAVKGRFTKEHDAAPLRKICDLISKHLGKELTALMAGVQQNKQSVVVGGQASQIPSSISAVRIGPGGQITPLTAATTVTKVQRTESNKQGPSESGEIKKHKNWELRYRCVNEMLNSQKMSALEDSLKVKLLPEIIFGLNEIHFVMEHDGAAVCPLKFRVCAQTSLQNVVDYSASALYQQSEKDSLFPVESASWVSKRKELPTFDPKMDWAFRNDYRGVWSDAQGQATALRELSAEEVSAHPDFLVDYDLLRNTNLPILFFASVDLWEDDLHDCGISKMSAKTRVMDPCFFVLVRHVLRVDGVRFAVRDTRHFHKFGSRVIAVEESLKSLDIAQYLATVGKEKGISSEEFHRTLMTSQVEQLDMLKEEWKKNFVIQF
jgi:type 2A phosphatase activator TIP41